MQRKPSTKRYRDRQRRQRRRAMILAAMATVVVVSVSRCKVDAAEPVATASPDFYKAEATVTPPRVDGTTLTVTPVVQYPCPLDLELQIYIADLCEERHISPAIIMAMCDVESDYRADLVGDNGQSYGLMQIMRMWHEDRIAELGVVDLLDPYQNVTVGIDYLDELIDLGNGLEWALMCYNGGFAYANELAASGVVSGYAQEVIEQAEILTEGTMTVVLQ